jgi:peptide/nickel transport system substrate-binding protein
MTPRCQRFAFLLSSFLALGVALTAHAATSPAPGALRIAVSAAPKTLDPAIATDTAAARLLQLTHPALLRWTPTYQATGLAASSCAQPNPSTITCTLPAGKTYTDGAPFTAASVAQWFDALRLNPRSPFSGPLHGVRVGAVSNTVTFALPAPTLSFVSTLTEIPLANPANPSAGLGPYVVQNIDTLGNTTLTTSDTTLPQLTFLAVLDPTTRLLKLKKGEIDIVYNDLPPQLVEWARTQKFNVLAVPGTSYSYLALNFRNPLLAQPAVREALALSLNRAAVRKYLLGDLATPATTLLPPTHPAAYNAPEEKFDPFTAEGTLDEANLLRGPDNTRFALTLLTSTDPFSQRVSQVIQAQYAKIGVAVTLRPTEWASFYDSVKKGDFDIALLAWTGELQPPFYFQAFNSRQTPPSGFNRGRVADPRTDALTAQIMQATTVQAQTATAIELQKYLADFRPYIPLYRRHQILITQPAITGCTLPPSGAYTGLLTCRK